MNCCPGPDDQPDPPSRPSDFPNDTPELAVPEFNDLDGDLSPLDMPSLLNNNTGDDDERDGSSVDSAEEVVADNSPVQSIVMPDLGRENENNLGILAGESRHLSF